MARLSVVMAHTGGPGYLRAALESLSHQTLADFELIVVDDAASIDVSAVCAAFPALSVTLIRNRERRGLACSLNLGIASCGTEFVARHDSDDLSSPTRLARQVEYLTANPELAVLGSAVRYIDSKGRAQTRSFPLTEAQDVKLCLHAYNQLSHGSVMMRVDALRHVKGYAANLSVAQDYELWLRLLRGGYDIANLPEVLYQQRIHSGSVSRKHGAGQLAQTRALLDALGPERGRDELFEFFASGRASALGRPYEQLQLGKLGIFVGLLATQARLPKALRWRSLGFAFKNSGRAAMVLGKEGVWHREWRRWLSFLSPA